MRGRTADLSPRGASQGLADLAEPSVAMTDQRLDRRRRRRPRRARRAAAWGLHAFHGGDAPGDRRMGTRWLLTAAHLAVEGVEVEGQGRLSAEDLTGRVGHRARPEPLQDGRAPGPIATIRCRHLSE